MQRATSQLADGCSATRRKPFRLVGLQAQVTPVAITLDRVVAEPDNHRRPEALRIEIEDLAEKDKGQAAWTMLKVVKKALDCFKTIGLSSGRPQTEES
jgi:hypothetical protein